MISRDVRIFCGAKLPTSPRKTVPATGSSREPPRRKRRRRSCELDPSDPHDVGATLAEADKAAAATLVLAEQRRYFSFAPGTVRSAIDDFIFLDMPAHGHKLSHDMEDYLERQLQCFVTVPALA